MSLWFRCIRKNFGLIALCLCVQEDDVSFQKYSRGLRASPPRHTLDVKQKLVKSSLKYMYPRSNKVVYGCIINWWVPTPWKMIPPNASVVSCSFSLFPNWSPCNFFHFIGNVFHVHLCKGLWLWECVKWFVYSLATGLDLQGFFFLWTLLKRYIYLTRAESSRGGEGTVPRD